MPRKDANFKLESESEASVIGSCFAEAITLLANKQHNQFNRPIIPRKKVFWEETRYNPPLANTHISAGYEAHLTEERLHWSRRGRRFPPELPQPSREKDKGPKKPEEFPKIFEKPVPVIHRRNESRTFTDVFKSSHAYTKVSLLRTSPFDRNNNSRKNTNIGCG